VRKISKRVVSSVGVAGAVASLLWLTVPAQAAYNGLSVQLHTVANIDGNIKSIYRVYANFTDPADRLYSIYGSPTLGALTLNSLNINGTGPGGAFYNSGANGNSAPSQETIGLFPNAQWDTFATIGVSVADQAPFGDQTSFSPGFPNIAGSSFTTSNGGWFVTPTFDHDNNSDTPQIVNPQSEAGFAGDGDVLNRVMFLQLTVNAGEHVAGTVNLAVFNNSGVAGGAGSQIIAQQTFNSVPVPSALALLGVASLVGSRRRRK
jgi:hypothetical protein